ncbi:MAG: LegC family aminotransferase [Proteobacteria bacterium]|nr:LegC family aminotransferase [Pseudomonadota bacterium]
MFNREIHFIRSLFSNSSMIPLHEPCFAGNEKKYVTQTIDSTFVSSVGEFVNRFERMICEYTGSRFAVATVNGTSALHIALILAGVQPDDEVITQPLTFVATANAITYCRAEPVFLDIDLDTLGLSPKSLDLFLKKNAALKEGIAVNIHTGKRISACVPMHTFSHACQIDRIVAICNEYNIPVIEDAAESLGSTYLGKKTGTFGLMGVYSFNGNKIITSGGGGMIVTDDESLAKRGKHLTTTARVNKSYEFEHDMVGYNYRMPNINAALACAQLENIDLFIQNKRELASRYKNFFHNTEMTFFCEPDGATSTYWLNAVLATDLTLRDLFLKETNHAGIMTRPAWKLMNTLDMFRHCQKDSLENADFIEKRLINLPSSVRL